MAEYKKVDITEKEPGEERQVATFKVTSLIWLLLSILEAALGIRFIFKLIGVNVTAFARFLYNVTGLFTKPFQGLLASPASGNNVLEVTTLIAMVIYALIAWAIERIIWLIFYRPRGPKSVVETTIAQRTTPSEPYQANPPQKPGDPTQPSGTSKGGGQ